MEKTEIDLNKLQCGDCGKIIDVEFHIPMFCPRCGKGNLRVGIPKPIRFKYTPLEDKKTIIKRK